MAADHAAALTRLAASRAALQRQLLPGPSDQGPHSGSLGGNDRDSAAEADSAAGPAPTALWRLWRRQLQALPIAPLAMAAARQWWRSQPWHGSAELLAATVKRQALPLVRRHPVASLAVAALAGLVLAQALRSRPAGAEPACDGPHDPVAQRPHPRRHHRSPLSAFVRRWLGRQWSQLPLQAIATGLLLLWAERQAAARPAPAASPTEPEKAPAP